MTTTTTTSTDTANADTERIPLQELIAIEASHNEPTRASFPDLRRKTLDLLYEYGEGKDKSPKGSVDVLIRPLIDLLNHHPAYASLSSCSGRISLFNPNHVAETQSNRVISDDAATDAAVTDDAAMGDASTETETTSATTSNAIKLVESGKGTGRWWLVSHDPIDNDPDAIITCLDAHSSDATSKPLVFKVEPLLLHITAATAHDAQKLLQIALSCGFRESGLIVAPTKVTVAIRGYSLALTVPLATSGELRPPDSYLRSLLDIANQRMHKNQEQSRKLYRDVQATLFRRAEKVVSTRCVVEVTHQLPPLNMWGHACVYRRHSDQSQGHEHNNNNNLTNAPADIWVFGGYGAGPFANTSGNRQPGSSRSSKVYKLEKRNGDWAPAWMEVATPQVDATQSITWHGMQLNACQYPASQGAVACLLQASVSRSSMLLWGGRKGPKEALNRIYLYMPSNSSVDASQGQQRQAQATTFYTPSQASVRGDPPVARWGHTMTALPGDATTILRLLIIGGCNADGAIVDADQFAFMLSIVRIPGATEAEFVWEQVEVNSDSIRPLFHHTAVHMPQTAAYNNESAPSAAATATTISAQDGDSHELIISGGLKVTNDDLLGVFDQQGSPKVWQCTVTKNASGSWTMHANPIASGGSDVGSTRTPSSQETALNIKVGMGGCANLVASTNDTATIILTGGCPINTTPADAHKEQPCFSSRSGSTSTPAVTAVQIALHTEHKGSRIIQHIPTVTQCTNLDPPSLDFGSLVHHACVCDTTTNEIMLIGGGVAGFAFGDVFARPYAGRLQLVHKERILGQHDDDGGGAAVGNFDQTQSSSIIMKKKKQSAGSSLRKDSTTSNSSNGLHMPPPTAHVLIVEARNAKVIKQTLEAEGLLDKRYRMVPYQNDDGQDSDHVSTAEQQHPQRKLIAVPICADPRSWKSTEWASMVIEELQQHEMPFATSQFARKVKKVPRT